MVISRFVYIAAHIYRHGLINELRNEVIVIVTFIYTEANLYIIGLIN